MAVAAIAAGAGALSIALFVGAAMAWNPYADYSLHRDVDARAWAALEPRFASSSSVCGTCHTTESAKLASASHAAIGCQSCHGPLGDHVLAGEQAAADSVPVAVPTDEVCVRCHVQADGRPVGTYQIMPAEHYVAACLACHDPHTTNANPPPVVEHPLDNLPPCLTCHGPEGFKARNQRHPVVESDASCLDCHAPGRGPSGDEEPR
jgi:hypothetical protein